jgi:acyl-CoA synthetase (NDP forming)
LEELENDEKTKVIAIYVESIEFGKKFFEIAKRISKKKPIVLVKSGMSNR